MWGSQEPRQRFGFPSCLSHPNPSPTLKGTNKLNGDFNGRIVVSVQPSARTNPNLLSDPVIDARPSSSIGLPSLPPFVAVDRFHDTSNRLESSSVHRPPQNSNVGQRRLQPPSYRNSPAADQMQTAIAQPTAHASIIFCTSHKASLKFIMNDVDGDEKAVWPPASPVFKTHHVPTHQAVSWSNQRKRKQAIAAGDEKRRARECKVDGCDKYIINRGLCFRHGVSSAHSLSIDLSLYRLPTAAKWHPVLIINTFRGAGIAPGRQEVLRDRMHLERQERRSLLAPW
jgi:hypothetical protein